MTDIAEKQISAALAALHERGLVNATFDDACEALCAALAVDVKDPAPYPLNTPGAVPQNLARLQAHRKR